MLLLYKIFNKYSRENRGTVWSCIHNLHAFSCDHYKISSSVMNQSVFFFP
uniref:Uncharacterized protein n=1 Tax=Anguilla anguilla TaxID=7936 RepID=A0A0E9TVU0_ANGAN